MQPQIAGTRYMPPPVRPQTSATSGVIFDGLLLSNQSRSASSTGPTSWSSNLLPPSISAGLTTGQTS